MVLFFCKFATTTKTDNVVNRSNPFDGNSSICSRNSIFLLLVSEIYYICDFADLICFYRKVTSLEHFFNPIGNHVELICYFKSY